VQRRPFASSEQGLSFQASARALLSREVKGSQGLEKIAGLQNDPRLAHYEHLACPGPLGSLRLAPAPAVLALAANDKNDASATIVFVAPHVGI
jgi:hypothetical protein